MKPTQSQLSKRNLFSKRKTNLLWLAAHELFVSIIFQWIIPYGCRPYMDLILLSISIITKIIQREISNTAAVVKCYNNLKIMFLAGANLLDAKKNNIFGLIYSFWKVYPRSHIFSYKWDCFMHNTHVKKIIKTFQVQCFEMVFCDHLYEAGLQSRETLHTFTLSVMIFILLFWMVGTLKVKLDSVVHFNCPSIGSSWSVLMFMRILNSYIVLSICTLYICRNIWIWVCNRVIYYNMHENEMMPFLDMFQSLSFTFSAFFFFLLLLLQKSNDLFFTMFSTWWDYFSFNEIISTSIS